MICAGPATVASPLIIASLPSMEFQRVHQQLLQSHHLFEPLSPVQLQELLASSDLVNLDKGAFALPLAMLDEIRAQNLLG